MPEENIGISSGLIGMLNVFVDPAGTARRVPAKLFWVWPVITLCIIYGVFGYLMLPYTLQMIDAKMTQQMSSQNVPPERVESCVMPAKNGRGLDEQDCVTPSWRHSCREDNHEALPGSPPNTTGEPPLATISC